MTRRLTARGVAALLLLQPASTLVAQDWSARLEAEGSLFPASPADPGQVRNGASLAFGPEWEFETDDRRHLITFEGFLRLDAADPDRTHADLRVASWEYVADRWELRFGLRRVFWGVTESQHLVDIINQTDLIESPDGEDKLGQPMVNLAWVAGFGTIDAFVMPLFRERTFPGPRGRLRFQPRVQTHHPGLFGGTRADRVDLAARWSHSIGAWDLGLSHFYGTSRDPRFALTAGTAPPNLVLDPVYEVIHQTGLDAQMTSDAWLWKLEAILRSGQGDQFGGLTGGFEYTFGGVFGSVADLGVLLEYSWDSRGEAVLGGDSAPLGFSVFQNDLFVGSRLALNDTGDTSLLVGGAVDLDTGSMLLSLETSRRIADDWTMEIEARAFAGADAGEPLYSLRRDDYVRVAVVRYF
ncbi:MAG: hypothetical protein ACE5FP_00450 [Gemmatimonadota bacterium]